MFCRLLLPGLLAPRGVRALLVAAVILTVALLLPAALNAQPVSAPPAKYRAEIRYQINAPRDEHVIQYRETVAGLQKLGFVFTPPLEDRPPTDPENIGKNTFEGLLPGKQAGGLMSIPHVEAALLIPADFKLPPQAGRVQVQLELSSGFSPPVQKVLADQVRALLQRFGFDEAVGYDHRGHTGRTSSRLRGTISSDQLEVLIKDLRGQPTGWFSNKVDPREMPLPLRKVNPVRLVEVLPDPSPPPPLPRPPGRGDNRLDSISGDLWQLIQAKEPQARPVRIEVLLNTAPDDDDNGWRDILQKRAPDLIVEGVLGNIVTGVFGQPFLSEDGELRVQPVDVGAQVRALAQLPFVSVVRLPRPARVQVSPAVQFPADNAEALKKTGLVALHNKGCRGQKVRLVVVDTDFRGYQVMIDQGKLPKDTLLVDLTAERNLGLLPDPPTGDPAQLGHGTQCALAAALAAPQAQILLVRVDPTCPYMLARITGFVRGEETFSPALTRRHEELSYVRKQLEQRRRTLLKERAIVLDSFEDESGDMVTYNFLGPVRPWIFTRREWHHLRMEEYEQAARRLQGVEERMSNQLKGIEALKGAQVISCALVWNDGYPLGGRSPLTRFLDARLLTPPPPLLPHTTHPVARRKDQLPALWFNSAGNTRGQTWYGPFRDGDGNGVMEFAGPEQKPPASSWTSELNFVGWLPYEGDKVVELPPGMSLRVSLQWNEPHDPDYYLRPGEEDWYRQPLAGLTLLVLRQRDPEAKLLPADDLEIVARSDELPQRLEHGPKASTYEISATWTTDKPGRYAIRIERKLPTRWLVIEDPKTEKLHFVLQTGRIPTGIRPLGVPTLPAVEPGWELQPRLYVEAVAGKATELGRPIFRDFFTDAGSVGSPADGRQVLAVGAARWDNQAEIYSAMGPPPFLDLRLAPHLFAYNRLGADGKAHGPAYGTSLATPFAAGLTASVLSTGPNAQEFRHCLQDASKKRVLRVKD
jgi:hypothetical protein